MQPTSTHTGWTRRTSVQQTPRVTSATARWRRTRTVNWQAPPASNLWLSVETATGRRRPEVRRTAPARPFCRRRPVTPVPDPKQQQQRRPTAAKPWKASRRSEIMLAALLCHHRGEVRGWKRWRRCCHTRSSRASRSTLSTYTSVVTSETPRLLRHHAPQQIDPAIAVSEFYSSIAAAAGVEYYLKLHMDLY